MTEANQIRRQFTVSLAALLSIADKYDIPLA